MLLLKRCASLQRTKLDEQTKPGDLYLYLTGGWRTLIFFCFCLLMFSSSAVQLWSLARTATPVFHRGEATSRDWAAIPGVQRPVPGLRKRGSLC